MFPSMHATDGRCRLATTDPECALLLDAYDRTFAWRQGWANDADSTHGKEVLT